MPLRGTVFCIKNCSASNLSSLSRLGSLYQLLLCFCLLLGSAKGEQLTFSKRNTPKQLTFNYVWQDQSGQTRDLALSLPKSAINRHQHKRFMPELAQRYVYVELHKAARKIDPTDAHVTIKSQGQDTQIEITSRSSKMLDKWQQQMQISKEKALARYLQENYYAHFQTYLGQQAIKPDHLRYIKENRAALLPLAQAMYEKVPVDSDVRAYLNLLLSWSQTIPYNPLENRLESNGAGYAPPLTVIATNRGDCDSKSVLIATLLSALLPDMDLIMLYLPNHALLGINLALRGNESAYNIAGKDYLLMDPTGPALMALGHISTRSQRAINNGMYTYEKISWPLDAPAKG
ncbi:MAG: hypothetical protein ACI9C4_000637 [Paraglaciecola sp.]|jgi:hypothetical protein